MGNLQTINDNMKALRYPNIHVFPYRARYDSQRLYYILTSISPPQRLLIALVGVLACIGSVTPTEPPQGPWQALNPSLGTPAQDKPQRGEVALTPEEEFLVNNIPFKLPFKMDKKQTAVAMKLMKEAVKPIIKSKTLQESVSYVDDLLHFLVDDIETQMYMTLFLDFMQDVYEGKEREQVDKIVRSFIHGNSDQVRQQSSRWRKTTQRHRQTGMKTGTKAGSKSWWERLGGASSKILRQQRPGEGHKTGVLR